MYDLFLSFIDVVESLGYLGIFFMTFIEGTFLPVPSELTLIPAGILISKQHFNLWYTLAFSILGTVAGALASYYIALRFGRAFLLKFSRYFFVTESKLLKMEKFFAKYGPISTFVGRLMPGLKHFISLPAGLGRMNFKLFAIYSTAGAFVWVSFVLAVGYFIGENQALVNQFLQNINVIMVGGAVLIALFYIVKKFFFTNKK